MISRRFLLILFIIIGCSTPIKHVEETIPQIEVTKRVKKIDPCHGLLPALKYLSRYQKKSKGTKFLRGKGAKALCGDHGIKINKILTRHDSKIKILYEDEIKLSLMNHEILKGINKVSETKKKKVEFIHAKVKNKRKLIDRAISDAVFKDKAGLVIAWGSEKFIKRVQFWQNKLDFPMLFIGGKSKPNENVFKVFPNQENYSEKLVLAMKNKGIKRIAVLTPTHYEKSLFLKTIKKTFEEHDIEIVYDIPYDSNNYESMNYACRMIFDIDKSKRWGEYQSIMRRERRKARAKGFKLNRKLVFLPARVNYDAIFIPDNFKIVNHFVKLFEYYQMPQIPLVGTHEWRSKDLTKTKSKLLSGSIFVDFVGDPRQLPKLVKQGQVSQMRVDESLGLGTDFQLMGYYSSRLATTAIKASKKKRTIVGKILKRVRIKDKFFRNKPAFKENNNFNWPSFSFEVQGDQITLSRN